MARDDHWFKFYYKLFLISTQGWKDDEVGAYLKLLINQFDRGGLPDDPSELSKLITTFKKNWPTLSKKFKKCEDGFLRNDFMAEIRIERDEKSKKNSELGKLGGRPSKKRTETETKANGFEIESHIYSPSLSVSGSLKEEGPGEENFLIPQMLQVFKKINPKYPIEKEIDFTALRNIAEKIKTCENLTGVISDNQNIILKRWGELSSHVRADNHLSKYSISQINKHFQSIIQSYSNGTHQQPPAKSTVRKSAGAEQLLASLKTDIAGLNGPGSEGY